MNDKSLHMIAGVLISLVFGWLCSPLEGFGASIVAGIAKEVWDYCGHGTPDFGDAIATAQGGCIGGMLVIFVSYVLG